MRLKTSYKTNSCDSVRECFSEYIDLSLTKDQQLAVHRHIKDCESCSHELDQLIKTVAVLVECRNELPAALGTFRIPRSAFIDVFHTLKEEKNPITLASFAPYVSVLLIYFLLICSFMFYEQRSFRQHYNASNYIEVRAQV